MALLSISADALSAQERLPRVSVDGSVGAGHGWRGGERTDRGLIAGDFLVTFQPHGNARRGAIIGLEVSRDWQLNGDLNCPVRPGGGCIPQYPGFDALSAVAGYDWGSSAVRARVLGGLGYYTAYFDHNSITEHSIGAGARTDIAARLFAAVFATATARVGWVPHIRGDSYVPGAFVIGLRIMAGA